MMETRPAPRNFSFLVVKGVPVHSERQFQGWLAQTIMTANTFCSHLTVSIYRLQEGDEPTYEVLFRFDNGRELEQWRHSPERKQCLASLEQIT